MTDEERFIQLGWEILEHKCRYYVLNNAIIEDYQYDMLEKEYDALADKLGKEKSASDMVGFNENRPSCREVLKKMTFEKKRLKKKRKKK